MRVWSKLRPKSGWGAAWRLLLLAVVAVGIDALWLEPSGIRAIRREIVLGHGGIGTLRIAVIADLHAGSPYIDEDKVRSVVALANGAKPDLILLAGDYVAGARGGKPMPIETTASLLKLLHAPLGVYAVIGNHDRWLNVARVTAALEHAGIMVLENRSVRLPGFALVGIGDDYTQASDPRRALADVRGPALCFTHSPDVFPELPSQCTLTIAGHTHGGQVRLPFLGRLVVPSKYRQRYAAGLVRENGKTLFVSTGIGTSIVPIRFMVPREVSILDLR